MTSSLILRATRLIAACEPFARDFEIYSIDETFLDLSGFESRDLVAHANAMRAPVQMWTTIPTCVGIAETKTLAKLANAAAKKEPRFAGVADLRDQDVRHEVMHAFAVGDVWGVGGATARKLTDLGIHTAGALRDMPMKQARAPSGRSFLSGWSPSCAASLPTRSRRSSRGARAWPSRGRSAHRSMTSSG